MRFLGATLLFGLKSTPLQTTPLRYVGDLHLAFLLLSGLPGKMDFWGGLCKGISRVIFFKILIMGLVYSPTKLISLQGMYYHVVNPPAPIDCLSILPNPN